MEVEAIKALYWTGSFSLVLVLLWRMDGSIGFNEDSLIHVFSFERYHLLFMLIGFLDSPLTENIGDSYSVVGSSQICTFL